jgi:flagellar operon protein
VNENGESFADILAKSKNGVEFSGHAMRRIESRSIDITQDSKLDRLNRGVELAAQKGSSDALVLVDSMAFVVSVKNNKVITTMDTGALAGSGNVFTNIDSTIII